MYTVLNPIWHITHLELTLRILAAAVMGGLIGFEREWSNHAAGLRTHILVCIGAASIMLLSIYGFSQFIAEPNVRTDPARLSAQVISGIGFLGAGAILRTGSTVSGLTTAASIWVVAAIGLCVGAGFFYCAALATVMVLLSLFVLNKWEKHLMRNRRQQEVIIKVFDRPGVMGKISSLFGEQGVQIVNVKMKSEESPQGSGWTDMIMELKFSVKTTHAEKLTKAIENISAAGGGDVISLESSHWKMPGSFETRSRSQVS
ncbi:MgtC/SapB family protein [Paenibacillus doosanensis]|uniref:Mg(2+) transport ATPase n=1 Tax=Paenibacillus konkukensis TaxID=2020716 RepID=A0ABY4RJ16_9BACL|nr:MULTISPECIES: MgtC/SapB family protein [Paenibacillus]MCS7464817.1 MgtC/SapB family protein [Paenibacillus doosanensis]UQZ82133.1 putative Mg(2+) transport ATPase [Paenibacillus konkukensis]